MVPKGSEPTYICSWLPLFHLFDPAARLIVKDYYAVGYKAWAHLLIQQAQPDINREFKSCLYLFGIQFAVYQIHVLIYCLFFYSFSFRFIEVESLVKESCFAGANGAGETAQRISATAGDAALVQDWRIQGSLFAWVDTNTNTHGYGSIPTKNTIFSGMNIHLPAILMFTRGTRFWHTATSVFIMSLERGQILNWYCCQWRNIYLDP